MYNDPPAVQAARSFDVEGLRNLIEAGADLDARSDGYLSQSALSYLCAAQLAEIGVMVDNDPVRGPARATMINMLLAAGASTEVLDGHGYTPLIMAVTNGLHPRIVAALLAAGADVNATTQPYRSTALHAAAFHGDRNGHIPMLLAAGASVDALDENAYRSERKTPLEVAICYDTYHPKLWRRAYPHLLRAGARMPRISPNYRTIYDLPPYIQKVVEAGGFVPYERAHRASLAAIFVPRFPQLPEEIVPRIVEFWAHIGFY